MENISKHIIEEEQYTKIINIAKIVLKNFDDIESLDRNDLYDIIYCKKKLQELVDSGIVNQDIRYYAEDIIQRIDIMMQSIIDDELERILSREIKNNDKINKKKYNTAKQYSDMQYVGDKQDIRYTNPIKEYIIKRFPTLVGILVLFPINLVLPDLASDMVKMPDSSIAETYTGLINVVQGLSSFILVILVVSFTIGIAVDLFYLMIPSFREFVDSIKGNNTFVSSEAIDALKTESYVTIAHQLNTNDRFDVAENIINLLSKELPNFIDFVKIYANDVNPLHTNENIILLESMYTDIQSIKGRIKLAKLRNRIDGLVEAELIYEKLEDFRKTYKEWLKSLEFEAYPV